MNTEAIEMLVAKWAEPNGIPFKGNLISDDGCMCAQGQALHYVGGLTDDQLRNIEQNEADKKTARLLGISVAHAVFLRKINDSQPGSPSVVLTDPAQVIGDQAETVLAFWRHLDRMSEASWKAAWEASRKASWKAAWEASRETAGYATHEIQGAAIMRERGQPFYFLPLFGFADPEAVLAADKELNQ